MPLIGMRNGRRRDVLATGDCVARRSFSSCAARRAGCGHVDVRVGPVGDQPVCACQHAGGHVRVQVERCHDRHALARGGAQSGQQFAFAVVAMLGHHGAVQVEVDGIGIVQAARGDDLARDPLECVRRDRAGRIGRRPQHRHRLVPGHFHGGQEACDRHIGVAQRQDPRAPLHRRPALAPDERVVGGPRWRERVGFVLEAGHQDLHGITGWAAAAFVGWRAARRRAPAMRPSPAAPLAASRSRPSSSR